MLWKKRQVFGNFLTVKWQFSRGSGIYIYIKGHFLANIFCIRSMVSPGGYTYPHFSPIISPFWRPFPSNVHLFWFPRHSVRPVWSCDFSGLQPTVGLVEVWPEHSTGRHGASVWPGQGQGLSAQHAHVQADGQVDVWSYCLPGRSSQVFTKPPNLHKEIPSNLHKEIPQILTKKSPRTFTKNLVLKSSQRNPIKSS